MTTTFELSGGFHNSSAIRIKLNGSFNNTTINARLIGYLENYITKSQRDKLEKHFCNIEGRGC